MTFRYIFGTTQKGRILRMLSIIAVLVILGGVLFALPGQRTQAVGANPGDLPTYMGSNARTSYNGAETIINTNTVSRLKLNWQYKSGGAIDTQPVVVNGVIYWGSWDGNEHATDLTGKQLWQTNLGKDTPPGKCIPTSAGVASTSTVTSVAINGINTLVDFVGGGDDKFYALNASTGAVLWSTALGTPPNEMIWAGSAFYNGNIYVGISSFGDCPLTPGHLFQINASTGTILHTFNSTNNNCNGAGIWDAPAVDEANNTIYVTTGTLTLCGAPETMAYALLELSATDLSLIHSWQVPQSQQQADSDFGTSPTLFTTTINGAVHQMVGALNKNGIYYAFDRANISTGPVWEKPIAGQKYNIVSSAWDGTTLYVGTAATTINGKPSTGSVWALDPATGNPRWDIPTAGKISAAPTVIPGLVIVGTVTDLLVLDAATGAQKFAYHDATAGTDFWASSTVSNGVLYAGNADGNLYAFGVPGGTTPPPPGPVSKTWYFAEGRVGGGFKEYLTLENPNPGISCSVNIQYLPEGGSAVTKAVTVPPTSRLTEAVNSDMNVPYTQLTGISVSALVTVNATPACNGIVAERPMYFNYHGINDGSDVVGATHTAKAFYFADAPSTPGTASFVASYLTILNPPGGAPAAVTATYYANGAQVGTQTISVAAGTRGTIAPAAITLPAHAAAIVTSTQPVVIERPSYFYNVLGGRAGVVSSSASVVGSEVLANDWLFAEGYTGGQTQENLIISNMDTVANATANVTINLEYANGTKHAFPVTVPTKTQLFWDVNASGTGATTPEVSAEVTSTGARIVVERKMFFHYTHTIPGTTVNVTSTGGTDVTGQVGPASKTSYSFAEGYTNANYNEWLTLQNPTGQAETVNVTLVNGLGRTYALSVSIGANSRATVDITAQVLQHLVTPGDAYPAYEVSMTAQTSTAGAVFVAERPEYWNTGTAGTQGGSDVIGYIGG